MVRQLGALSLSLSVITACGGRAEDQPQSTSDVQPEEGVTPEASDPFVDEDLQVSSERHAHPHMSPDGATADWPEPVHPEGAPPCGYLHEPPMLILAYCPDTLLCGNIFCFEPEADASCKEPQDVPTDECYQAALCRAPAAEGECCYVSKNCVH